MSRALADAMREDEPPPPPAPPRPAPSRLKRTLRTLSSPFRSGSPFHIASLKRTGSAKSSVSDGEIARDERTMRKKNKKLRADAPASTSRSSDSSPVVKKKDPSLLKRMGSIGKHRSDSTDLSKSEPEPENAPRPQQNEDAQTTADSTVNNKPQRSFGTDIEIKSPEESVSPEQVFSPIAVEHPVAMRAFTKAGWKKRNLTEIQKPIEEPSPEGTMKRRIAFVSQFSMYQSEEDRDDEEEEEGRKGEVGSLEEAVALARERLAGGREATPPHSRDNVDTEEEGYADASMPAYGDLIEPEKAGSGDGPVSACALDCAGRRGARARRRRLSGRRPLGRCARAMTFEETADECYLTVCECCGFSAETSLLYPSHATSSAERREHLYKILVIGELGTGKTSIIKRYVHQFFSQHYRATIGVDFALKVLNWDANTIIRLQLWDIAGQERFGNMTRVYYKEAVGAFIVFDVSRVATFDAVVKWKNDLDTKVQLPDGSPIPCILLANKCDQQKEGIVNSPAKMDEYCREKGFAGWFETSAKENINIEEAARSLVNKILLNDKLLQNNDKDGERFALDHKIANGENTRDSGPSKSCAC
ncbi:unnamed protein product [Colias eurytheme]|nr:unnamed protein product [Colias eurytheme]